MQVQVLPQLTTQMKGGTHFLNRLFKYLFCFHLLTVTILAIFLIIRDILSDINDILSDISHARKYLPILVSNGFAGILGYMWQALTASNPTRSLKAASWLGPLLACGVGVLLLAIGTAASLGVAVLALLLAVILSLYSCWASRRFDYAGRILSLAVTFSPAKVCALTFLSILVYCLYSSLLLSAIETVSFKRSSLKAIFVLLMLLSLLWTSHTIKNILQVTVSQIKYMNFTFGTEIDTKMAFKNTVKHSIGTICIGSILVPIVCVIRGSARAIVMASGDANEFLFSCTSCYSAIASRLVRYGNRWGFVQVGVYNKGLVQSSVDTWDMFRQAGMEQLINSDLTSSFSFLSGVAGGAASALVAGSWTLKTHRSFATEVTIYTFLSGYFMSRIATGWLQASVSACYVAYAENPMDQRFDGTITDRIQETQRPRA